MLKDYLNKKVDRVIAEKALKELEDAKQAGAGNVHLGLARKAQEQALNEVMQTQALDDLTKMLKADHPNPYEHQAAVDYFQTLPAEEIGQWATVKAKILAKAKEFENAAKAADTLAQQQAAALLQDIQDNPAGQTLKHAVLKKLADSGWTTGKKPTEILKEVTEQAAAEQAKKSLASALSGAKKNYLADKPLTPAQLKAVESLSPTDQGEWYAKLDA